MPTASTAPTTMPRAGERSEVPDRPEIAQRDASANWAASAGPDSDKVVTSNVATMNHFADRSPRRWAAVNQATRITPNRANGRGDMISRVPFAAALDHHAQMAYRLSPTTAAIRNAIETARKLSRGRQRPTDAPITSIPRKAA